MCFAYKPIKMTTTIFYCFYLLPQPNTIPKIAIKYTTKKVCCLHECRQIFLTFYSRNISIHQL